jgi:hypothetical protein
VHSTSLECVCNAFREVRNALKTKIKAEKRSFKNSKKVWKVIHSILNPCSQPLRHDVNELNQHIASTVQRTLGHSNNVNNADPFAYIDFLPVNPVQKFDLKKVSQAEVLRELHTKYIKPVACTASNSFPSAWKISRISPIPKSEAPIGTTMISDQSQSYPSRPYERLDLDCPLSTIA